MISLRNKLKVAPTPEPPTEPQFVNTAYLPEHLVNNPVQSKGNEFNLVRLVQEHAPTRLQVISEELARLQEKMQKLESEKGQIQKLLDALA